MNYNNKIGRFKAFFLLVGLAFAQLFIPSARTLLFKFLAGYIMIDNHEISEEIDKLQDDRKKNESF